tara:strand:- start:167 stop:445 length:279 start_codon:yes stop_codon:yes gene_type:complete
MQYIVKTKGHTEQFDERKVYGSVYAACASAHRKEDTCENLADTVTKKVKQMIKTKKQVDSNTIRQFVEKELKRIDGELAFFYEQHLPNLKEL